MESDDGAASGDAHPTGRVHPAGVSVHDIINHDSNNAGRPRPRSCNLCHQRKIRCDKKDPCTHCVRAEKQCVYPPSGPRVRRTKRTLMADMASRLSSLERTLTSAAATVASTKQGSRGRDVGSSPESDVRGDSASGPASAPVKVAPSTSETPSDRGGGHRQGEDIVVEKGSSSQYFNGYLLSRVIQDEDEVRSVLTTPQAAQKKLDPTPFNPLGILSSPSLTLEVASLHPSKSVALKLWKVFQERVEDIPGYKVLHQPTDEIRIYTTIEDPSAATFENLALCFAVYFTALLAIDDLEIDMILEEDTQTSLFNFKAGLEQAFAQGDFLDRPSITTLSALAIYMVGLRVHHRGRSIWILNGMAIRMAQCLGLHRNGEGLGLSPFQCEIRRRLWWHIIGRDGRAGEDYGLQVINHLYDTNKVAKPLNLEDVDLYPDMKELPAPRRGWTPMTFCIVAIDVSCASARLDELASNSTPESPPNEHERRKVYEELKESVDRSLEHCNHAIPRQRMTISLSRFIVHKMNIITQQQWSFLSTGGSWVPLAKDKNLNDAIDVLDIKLAIKRDPMLKQYSWSHPAYPQYHALLYALWHLCVRPEGPGVDHAWDTIDSVFADDMEDPTIEGYKSKEAILFALRAKAKLLRKQKDQNSMDQPSSESAEMQQHPQQQQQQQQQQQLPHRPESSLPAAVATMTTPMPCVADGQAWQTFPAMPPGLPQNPMDLDIESLDWEGLIQEFKPIEPNVTYIW